MRDTSHGIRDGEKCDARFGVRGAGCGMGEMRCELRDARFEINVSRITDPVSRIRHGKSRIPDPE
jgi:hypothetical protein